MRMNLLYRFPLALLAMLFSCTTIFAKPVDPSVALQVGKHFFQSTKKGRALGENLDLMLVYGTPEQGGSDLFYVFNVNGTAGFVIVAADDAVQPILGYSNEGPYEPLNVPVELTGWLSGYHNEIQYVRENNLEATALIRNKWASLEKEVPPFAESGGIGPLLETKWDQGPNENMFCPGGSVTGCVATAMAQVMYFWKHPAQGKGSHSYLENDYGTLTADFGATIYQWGSMPWHPTSPNNWISTLMLHCGISLDMNYSPSTSGAATAEVADALIKYFKYDPATVQYVARENYTDADWVNLLKQELNAYRPMEYRGVGSGGGHAFVCDGYDDNSLFHMNWGWGGSSDGFFAINALNPGSTGTGGGSGGYNSGQGAVIGIKPDPNLLPDLQMLTPPYMANSTPFYGQTVSVDVEFANTGGQDFTGDVTIGIYNETDGSLLDVREDLAYTFWGIGGGGAVVSYSFPVYLPPGNYNAVLMYRNQGETEWSQVGHSVFPNSANFLVYSPSTLRLGPAVTVATPNPVVQGNNFSITAYFTNPSPTAAYYTRVSANLHKLDGSWIQEIGHVNSTFLPGAPWPLIFEFPNGINVPPGTYKLVFWEKPNGGTDQMVQVDYTYPGVDYLTVLAAPPAPDVYEPNNSPATAFTMPLNFQGNTAFASTYGSNNHNPQDVDYYLINFPYNNNYIYRVTGHLFDSEDNSNGGTFTNDGLWRFSNNGNPWSPPYDDVLTAEGGEFFIRNGYVLLYEQSNFAGTMGNYYLEMEVNRIPAIDHPCGAANLPVNGQPQMGYTNANATASVHHEPNIPPPGDCLLYWCDTELEPRAQHTIWFTFQAPPSGMARVSTCNLADFDTQMAIYSASDCNDKNTFTLLAANDDGNDCNGYTSLINMIGLTPGQTYYIMIDGYEGATGNLGIKVSDLMNTEVENIAASPEVLQVAPNPSEGMFHIQLTGERRIEGLSVSDLSGKNVWSQPLDQVTSSYDLDLNHLPNGVYMLQVRTSQAVIAQKIVLQR